MRVLVACEFSGVVREAFNAIPGVRAMSCDIEPPEDLRYDYHFQGDVLNYLGHPWDLGRPWDLMISHPPCKYLANSGIRWLYRSGRKVNGRDPDRWEKMRAAAEFLLKLWNARIERICIEQPIDHIHAEEIINIPVTQSIQPWMFGHWETKETCLRLKNLPPLVPTYRSIDECREALGLPADAMPTPRVHYASPGPDRWKERSRTPPLIAAAMAGQWGSL